MTTAEPRERYRWLVRLLEMVPGMISWSILILPIWLSFSYPALVALFVLSFDFYWLCRALWFSGAVIVAFRRIRGVLKVDWTEPGGRGARRGRAHPPGADPDLHRVAREAAPHGSRARRGRVADRAQDLRDHHARDRYGRHRERPAPARGVRRTPSPSSSTSSTRSSRGSWSARAARWRGAAATCIGCSCASAAWIRSGSWSPTSTRTTASTRSTSPTWRGRT